MRPALVLTLALALLAPAAASAATVTAADAVPRDCRVLATGAPGVATARYTAAQTGLVTVRLDGHAGNWDLTLFTAAGARDTGSAGLGARERAVAYLHAGQTLVAQACRHSGPATADLDFDLYPYVPPADAPKASLVRVAVDGAGDVARLEEAGLDVTHERSPTSATVVLYGDADAAKVRALGLQSTEVIGDLRAHDRRDLARRATSRALPTGRTSYRTYADYGTELQALATQHPGLTRGFTVGTSLEGRSIDALEIGENVGRADDGRPTLAIFGLHHAREWPSGEMPMEFATELIKRYEAGDPRVVNVLRNVRVLLVPVVNPDGFVVSRDANGGATSALDDDDQATAGQAITDTGAYKRKNCRANVAGTESTPCAARSGGVDLNRNYGAYWGGAGTSASATAQTTRGPAPFSEPESEAIHRLSQRISPVTVISHHTFTDEGEWLRQPGFCMMPPAGCGAEDVVPDEAGMAALGGAMASATGWQSNLGWAIGEITGATEDWNYFATGAYGYTPEQRATNFHSNYQSAVVDEYGSGTTGVGEALLRAAEQAADDAQHSVLTGTGPAGRTLHLRKAFVTPTSQAGVVVNDALDLTLTIPASGSFTWDVNPSTRPLAGAKEAYTLSCDGAGTTQQVVVDRGQRLDVGAQCGFLDARPGGTGTPPPAAPPIARPSAVTPRTSLSLAARQRRSTVLARGVLVAATCATDCTLRPQLRKPAGAKGTTVLGRRTLKLRAGRKVTFRVRLSAAGRRAVVRYRHARVTLRVGTTSRSVQLVRR